jgi:hypothetical protein
VRRLLIYHPALVERWTWLWSAARCNRKGIAMTYNQPPMGPGGYQPQYYTPGQYVVPSRRPGSVTTLAIIGIILGSLGLLCCGWGIIGNLIGNTANAAFAGQQAAFRPTAAQNAWNLINSVVNFLLSGMLLAGSIGSLMLARWARLLMIIYAMAAIAMALVMLVMNFAVVLPAMEDVFRQTAVPRNASFDPASFGRMIMIITTLLTFLVMMIYPICVLVFYRRPNVVAAFEGAQTQSHPY